MNSKKYLDRIGGADGTTGVVLVRLHERWVNPATVVQIAPSGEGVRVHLIGGQTLEVDMTVADVAGLIAGQDAEAPRRHQFGNDPDAWMQGGEAPAAWNHPRPAEDSAPQTEVSASTEWMHR